MDIGIKELEEMSAMDFDSVRIEDIPVFGEIKHDIDISPEERVRTMLKSGKNPYFRKSRDGKMLVKISFSNNGVKLADALAGALIL